MVFVTDIFASSIICLIRQNMVRMKQKVQTNHDMLTRKPAGYEGPTPPGRTLDFIAMQDSDLSTATSGAQFPKALLHFSPGHSSDFQKHVIPDVESPFENPAVQLGP